MNRLIALSLAAAAFAGDPGATPDSPPKSGPAKAVITGPIDGVPGDFIDLSGEESFADKLVWIVDPPRFPDGKITHKIAKDGKTCQLASRPGIYTVRLLVSNCDGPAEGTHKVTIFNVNLPGAGTPTIPPSAPPVTPPVTPPITPPVTPPPAATLTEWARDAATRLVTSDPARASTAADIADAYRKWTVNGAGAATGREFAIGMDFLGQGIAAKHSATSAWDPYFKAYAEKMSSLCLDSVQQHITAALQIAAGLEQVK